MEKKITKKWKNNKLYDLLIEDIKEIWDDYDENDN